MASDKSLKLQGRQAKESLSSDAEDWGRQFVKHLELEYLASASELPADATWTDFRRTMTTAIASVLREVGAAPEDVSLALAANASHLGSINENVEWTSEKNACRLKLIDKAIQQTITSEEARELRQLTEQMRAYCDREEMVPLEGGRRLHRRLLEMGDVEGPPS